MHSMNGAKKHISLNKSFLRLIISQGIMEIGDNLRILAVTMLLIKCTGTGLAAGFGLVVTPVVGFIISPIAGVLGDRLEGGKLLSILFLTQGLLILSFINNRRLHIIYIILTIIAGIQTLQDPIYRKKMRDLLHKDSIVIGNSLSTGISGFANLIGPIFGGMIVQNQGIYQTFMVAALLYTLSSLVLLSIKNKNVATDKLCKERITKNGIMNGNLVNKKMMAIESFWSEIRKGIGYFWGDKNIRNLGIASFVLAFGTASVSFAFYAFAFDLMNVSAGQWGFMMSVFYSSRLFAMFLSVIMDKVGNKGNYGNIYIPLFFICLVWLSYGALNNFIWVVLLLLLEGTFHFLFEILLWSGLQVTCQNKFVARIISINNIQANGASIAGIIFTLLILKYWAVQAVFFANGAIICFYLLFIMLCRNKGLK